MVASIIPAEAGRTGKGKGSVEETETAHGGVAFVAPRPRVVVRAPETNQFPEDLPTEIFFRIINKLGPQAHGVAAQVCRGWYHHFTNMNANFIPDENYRRRTDEGVLLLAPPFGTHLMRVLELAPSTPQVLRYLVRELPSVASRNGLFQRARYRFTPPLIGPAAAAGAPLTVDDVFSLNARPHFSAWCARLRRHEDHDAKRAVCELWTRTLHPADVEEVEYAISCIEEVPDLANHLRAIIVDGMATITEDTLRTVLLGKNKIPEDTRRLITNHLMAVYLFNRVHPEQATARIGVEDVGELDFKIRLAAPSRLYWQDAVGAPSTVKEALLGLKPWAVYLSDLGAFDRQTEALQVLAKTKFAKFFPAQILQNLMRLFWIRPSQGVSIMETCASLVLGGRKDLEGTLLRVLARDYQNTDPTDYDQCMAIAQVYRMAGHFDKALAIASDMLRTARDAEEAPHQVRCVRYQTLGFIRDLPLCQRMTVVQDLYNAADKTDNRLCLQIADGLCVLKPSRVSSDDSSEAYNLYRDLLTDIYRRTSAQNSRWRFNAPYRLATTILVQDDQSRFEEAEEHIQVLVTELGPGERLSCVDAVDAGSASDADNIDRGVIQGLRMGLRFAQGRFDEAESARATLWAEHIGSSSDSDSDSSSDDDIRDIGFPILERHLANGISIPPQVADRQRANFVKQLAHFFVCSLNPPETIRTVAAKLRQQFPNSSRLMFNDQPLENAIRDVFLRHRVEAAEAEGAAMMGLFAEGDPDVAGPPPAGWDELSEGEAPAAGLAALLLGAEELDEDEGEDEGDLPAA